MVLCGLQPSITMCAVMWEDSQTRCGQKFHQNAPLWRLKYFGLKIFPLISRWYIICTYLWLRPRQLTTDQLPHRPFLCDMCCLHGFCMKSVKLLRGIMCSEEENPSRDTSFVFKIWYGKKWAAHRESELWDPFQLYRFFCFSNVSFPVERNWKSAQSITLSSHQHRMSPIIPPVSCRHLALWWYLSFFFMHLSFYLPPACLPIMSFKVKHNWKGGTSTIPPRGKDGKDVKHEMSAMIYWFRVYMYYDHWAFLEESAEISVTGRALIRSPNLPLSALRAWNKAAHTLYC